MRPVLIIQAGNPPRALREQYGGFDAMLYQALGLAPAAVCVRRVYHGEALGPVADYGGAIITGSPANITDRLDWSEQAADWLRRAMDAGLPLLGICFGHQLLTHALGGRVDFHPDGREIGTHDIRLTAAGRADPLLQGVPAVLAAHFIHEQSVLEAPPGAVVLAENDHDRYQMLRHGERAISMQYHPEFSAAIMRGYLSLMREQLAAEGADVDALLARVADTATATGIARRFVQSWPMAASA